ncbi:hypothetical protein [Parasitella parasitica]|uniref:Uncharacterized protein n=1 Tax=Parasitella parasitica TaxID=35722 RepID=A0A0B7N9K0_9FUNG|nr:hypothetical protein [Parasitella parasitica]
MSDLFFLASLGNSVQEVKNYISRQNTPEPGTPPPAGNEAHAEAAVGMPSQDQQAAVLDTSESQGSSSNYMAQDVALNTADQEQGSSSKDTAEDDNNND